MSAPKTLPKRAAENPFEFFTVAEVAELFGFGRNVMTTLIEMGAPVVARKINPRLLMEWLSKNAGDVGKIREE